MNDKIKRVNILGVAVSAINISDALLAIDNWISSHEQRYVCVTPAHSIMDAYHDPCVQEVLNGSGMTTPDGMAIVWLLKLQGYYHVSRVYGPDLLLSVCENGIVPGYRHFFYGGTPRVAEDIISKLRKLFPEIQIAGSYSPPFRPLTTDEEVEIQNKIDSSKADIVWVGLSSPKQDLWMAEHLGVIEASVMVGVGAAFDFLSGHKSQAPRWLQRSGLEWLFRLASEPHRLWPRYRQYPKFLFLIFAQLLGLKKFPIEE